MKGRKLKAESANSAFRNPNGILASFLQALGLIPGGTTFLSFPLPSGESGRCIATTVLRAAIKGWSRIVERRKMGNCPVSPPNKSRNVNRDWVRGYSIGRDIDNISDGMLPLTVHKI